MTDDSVYGPYGSGKGTLGKPKPGQQRPQPRMRMRERIVRWGRRNHQHRRKASRIP